VLQWFAVLTKPRAERIGRAHLERQGFECRLPLLRRESRARRAPASAEPLFPRYLFLRADPARDDLACVRSTRGVCGLVRFGVEPARVPQGVVDALAARSDDDGVVRLDPPELVPGAPVRIVDGPLAGLDAIFRAPGGEQRVHLLVRLIGGERAACVPLRHLALHL
jgi:transcriptional antiterminator RfaH